MWATEPQGSSVSFDNNTLLTGLGACMKSFGRKILHCSTLLPRYRDIFCEMRDCNPRRSRGESRVSLKRLLRSREILGIIFYITKA